MSQFDESGVRAEEARPWRWRLEGEAVDAPAELANQSFASQADAESWVGEFWPELAEAGVSAVTLLEADREVYGPMSLEA